MIVATIVVTCPEIIRLSRVMAALDRYTEHVIIHAGQNYDYELNQIFCEDLEFRKPDFFLDASGTTAAETIGLVIARVDAVLREIRPDAVLVLGDTNSCLAAIDNQAPEDPRLPHGGRQPLPRPARARRDQTVHHRPHQRHQPALLGHRA